MRTPVSTGSMSSRPAAVTAWATACANTSLATVPVAAGHLGQGRVVLDRHGLQAEPRPSRRSATTLAPSRAISTGLFGQAAADVGEQPAADQGPALVGDLGREGGPRRGLVVEGRQRPDRRRSASIRSPASDRDAGTDRAGCAPPRRRHRRARRGRRGTSRWMSFAASGRRSGRRTADVVRPSATESAVSILPRGRGVRATELSDGRSDG